MERNLSQIIKQVGEVTTTLCKSPFDLWLADAVA